MTATAEMIVCIFIVGIWMALLLVAYQLTRIIEALTIQPHSKIVDSNSVVGAIERIREEIHDAGNS